MQIERYLNEGKDQKNHDSTKQERTKEIEIIASLSSHECVQSETHNHHCSQDYRFQNDLPCNLIPNHGSKELNLSIIKKVYTITSFKGKKTFD